MHLCNLSTGLCLVGEREVPSDLTMHLSATAMPCSASTEFTPPYRDLLPFGQNCVTFAVNWPFHSTKF